MDKSNSIGNRLKHRIAQMLLSSSCTTTTSATKFADKISQEPVFPSSNRHVHHGGGKLDHLPHRMAPVVQVSIDCSSRRSVRAPNPNLPSTTKQGKRNPMKERRVTGTGVVYETGVGEGRKCPPASPSSPSNVYYYSHSKERKKAMAKKKDKLGSKKKKLLSTSSGSDDEFGFFSSEQKEEEEEEGEEEEEAEETWTLFSSKSFSSDSSEFYHRASSKKKTRNKKSTGRPPRRGARYFKDIWDEGNEIQPLASISSREKMEMAAAARSGFAVVKRSSDPYEDFRSSMVEMIIERRMSETEDLEELLCTYLSLNSPSHHAVIVEAFTDIWEAVCGEL